jgi:hypothetical protein
MPDLSNKATAILSAASAIPYLTVADISGVVPDQLQPRVLAHA